MVTLTWHARYINSIRGKSSEDVPLVELMYLVFTHMPSESYCRQLRTLLLCLCDVFQALINSPECLFCLHSVCVPECVESERALETRTVHCIVVSAPHASDAGGRRGAQEEEAEDPVDL